MAPRLPFLGTVCATLSLLLGSATIVSSQVLHSDDFNRQPSWIHLVAGSWRITGGVLQSADYRPLASPGNEFSSQQSDWVALGDPSWSDYQVEFDLQFADGEGSLALATHLIPNWDSSTPMPGRSHIVQIIRPVRGASDLVCYDYTCGNELRTLSDSIEGFLPGWHHLVAVVTPGHLRVLIDARVVLEDYGVACADTRTNYFAIGSVSGGRSTVEVDNVVVQRDLPTGTQSPQSWGRVKATYQK